jgi:cytochrome c biogenesis protein CcmG/thiol:disulfide interchange protein DsbE
MVNTTPKRPSWLFPVILVVVVVLILIGFAVALDNGNRGSINSGPAPEFATKLEDGQLFKLADKRGKVVIMNFWASWCGPCRDEAPYLNQLWVDYKDKGVEFIGVGYLDNPGDAKAFRTEVGMAYPTAPDDGALVSRAFRVRQVPETYLIDKKGVIAIHLPGPLSGDNVAQFRAVLDRLLAS